MAFVQDFKCFQGVYFSTSICLMSLIGLLQNLEYFSACFCCFFVNIQCKQILSIVLDEVYCWPATKINIPFMQSVLYCIICSHVLGQDLMPMACLHACRDWSNRLAHFPPPSKICPSFLPSSRHSLSPPQVMLDPVMQLFHLREWNDISVAALLNCE